MYFDFFLYFGKLFNVRFEAYLLFMYKILHLSNKYEVYNHDVAYCIQYDVRYNSITVSGQCQIGAGHTPYLSGVESSWHVHLKDPAVFTQISVQPPLSSSHSFISEMIHG